MLTIANGLQVQAQAAVSKVALARRPSRFFVSAMLAGAYVGIGVLLMLATAGPLLAAGSPWTPLVQGMVFGIALVLVIFAGSELATSAMMILTQGALLGRVPVRDAVATLLLALGGNLVGAVTLAALVSGAGTISPTNGAGTMLAYLIEHKTVESNGQLFFRGVLCNVLVCLAIWSVGRMSQEIAKIAVVAWCLFAFVSMGFEHVIANMTTFSLAIMQGVDGATIGSMARNLLWVGLGNTLGGALFVGAAYVWTAKPTRRRHAWHLTPGDEDAAARETVRERAELEASVRRDEAEGVAPESGR